MDIVFQNRSTKGYGAFFSDWSKTSLFGQILAAYSLKLNFIPGPRVEVPDFQDISKVNRRRGPLTWPLEVTLE